MPDPDLIAPFVYEPIAPPRDLAAVWMELVKLKHAARTVSGSFTATVTNGFTADFTTVVEYVQIGSMVWLKWGLATGTSNATTMRITGLPQSLWPQVNNRFLLPVVDNGATVHGMCTITASNGQIDFGATIAGGGFTNSGTKGLQSTQFGYMLKK